MKIAIIALLTVPHFAFANIDCSKLSDKTPLVEENTCPNHCQLGKWTTISNLDIYDRPTGKVIGRLKANDEFQALKGQTHVTPSRAKVISNPPKELGKKLKVGDAFYILSYQGEGVSSACIGGKMEMIDCTKIDNYPACTAKNAWAHNESGKSDDGNWWDQISSKKVNGWILHSFDSVKGSTSAEPEN